LAALGFELVATRGTAEALMQAGVETTTVRKVAQGSPHVVDALRSGEIDLVINTTVGARAVRDSYAIRRQALLREVPYFTTMSAALAVADSLALAPEAAREVRSLQEWHAAGPAGARPRG